MGFFHTIFLSDGFRPVRASLFGNPLREWAIIKSRLCREAAKVGGGLWPPVGVKGRTDSHASDVGHWLGMTPLRGVWADRVVRPYGRSQGVRRSNGGRGTPRALVPLRSTA